MNREREQDAEPEPGEATPLDEHPAVSGESTASAEPEVQELPPAVKDATAPASRPRFGPTLLAAGAIALATLFFLLGFAFRAATEDDVGSLRDDIRSLDERTGSIKETLDSLTGGAPTPKGNPAMEMTADGDDPSWGPDDASVTIQQFADFQCPYCGRFAIQTMPALKEQYQDKVRFVFRDFPLGGHQYARLAAQAGQCAQDQSRFWEYHDLLFANQSALASDQLKQYAAQAGLDTAAFDECLDSGKNAQEIVLDMQEGEQAGVTGTPAFIINGEMVSGARPLEQFQAAIDQALADAG